MSDMKQTVGTQIAPPGYSCARWRRLAISAAAICCCHSQITASAQSSAKEALDFLVKFDANPRVSVRYLVKQPLELDHLRGFDDLKDADQERLLSLARDATNGYARIFPHASSDRREWSRTEVNYCKQWLSWYSDKYRAGGFQGTDEVTPGTAFQHLVKMITYLGEADCEAGDFDLACEHFASYVPKFAFVSSKWLEVWGKALARDSGSPWQPSVIRTSLGDPAQPKGPIRKEAVNRWKQYSNVLSLFIKKAAYERSEWERRRQQIDSEIQRAQRILDGPNRATVVQVVKPK